MLVVTLAVTACGRYWFEPHDDAGSNDARACAFTFCDDFDRAGPIEAGWDPPHNSGGATLALASDVSVSPPQSYVVGLPAPALESGYLIKALGPATASARIAVSVGYESTDVGTAEVDLIALKWDTLPPPCTSFGYYLIRDGTGPFDLQETYGGCGGNENTPFTPLENTGFHAVEMFVTFGPIGTAAVRVDMDGTTLVNKTTSHAIAPSGLSLWLGAGASRDMVAPWQVRYDDLIVDLR